MSNMTTTTGVTCAPAEHDWRGGAIGVTIDNGHFREVWGGLCVECGATEP